MAGKACFFQNEFWYESKEVWLDSEKQLDVYLKTNTMLDITKSLDTFHKKNKKTIKEIVLGEENITTQIKEVYEILKLCATFIWLAHGLEAVYQRRLDNEVPKYIKKDIKEFIGDASFPKKKNKHALMEEDIRNNKDPEEIAKEYGWIKCRFNFDEPFTAEEIKQIKKELKPEEPIKKINIPEPLEQLFKEVQELVYFRTARTDVTYELLFLARPILKKVAEHYKIPFQEIKNYSLQSLVEGKPKKFNKNHSLAFYEEEFIMVNEPILKNKEIQTNGVKGTIAFKGITKGTVKIVKSVKELTKIQKGDVLVTPMTFPSYIAAMNRAVAFVTDEGGITCHAAIVAREMHKPCIIGTKNATTALNDNDFVEVDAEKGTVKIIKKAE